MARVVSPLREKRREARKRSYLKHRQKILLYLAEYRRKNRDKISAYRKANKEQNKIQSREWYRNNRDYALSYAKSYKQKVVNPSRRILRIKAVNFLGGKCVKCGFSDIRALQIDHINGCQGRSRYRWKVKEAGPDFHAAILNGKKDKSQYQILCANCNVIKAVENKEVRGYKEQRGIA